MFVIRDLVFLSYFTCLFGGGGSQNFRKNKLTEFDCSTDCRGCWPQTNCRSLPCTSNGNNTFHTGIWNRVARSVPGMPQVNFDVMCNKSLSAPTGAKAWHRSPCCRTAHVTRSLMADSQHWSMLFRYFSINDGYLWGRGGLIPRSSSMELKLRARLWKSDRMFYLEVLILSGPQPRCRLFRIEL